MCPLPILLMSLEQITLVPIKNPEFTVLHSEGHNKGEKNA